MLKWGGGRLPPPLGGRWEVSLSTAGTLPAALPFPFPLFYSEVPKSQPFVGY